MFFSDYYKILHTGNDDWFDPIVSVDTKLFVDPFLIFADRDGHCVLPTTESSGISKPPSSSSLAADASQLLSRSNQRFG